MHLSPRERQCLKWAAEGKSSWDIGVILSISENTVNFHVKNAMRKLGVSRRTVAAIKAIDLGLIERPHNWVATVMAIALGVFGVDASP
jgi:LuxR family transcriptional activator of conjugal transfer of Ti plasmids